MPRVLAVCIWPCRVLTQQLRIQDSADGYSLVLLEDNGTEQSMAVEAQPLTTKVAPMRHS